MEWNNDIVIHFIEQYKNKPNLWDHKNSKYYNKNAKNYAWGELADEMNITADVCKRKMTSLLASFRREKMKIRNSHRTSAGKDDVYKSSWFAFKSLAFTMDRDIPKPILNMDDEEWDEPVNNSFQLTSVIKKESSVKRDCIEFPTTRPIKKKKKR